MITKKMVQFDPTRKKVEPDHLTLEGFRQRFNESQTLIITIILITIIIIIIRIILD